jgi:hypothetical protein
VKNGSKGLIQIYFLVLAFDGIEVKVGGSPKKTTQKRKAGDFGHDSGHGRTNCGHGEISYSSIKKNSGASVHGNLFSPVGYGLGAAAKKSPHCSRA